MSAEQGPKSNKKIGTGEKSMRFLRDINLLGALAIAGAAIIAPPALVAPLGLWAGVNAAQGGGFEIARRHLAKQRSKKQK